MITTTVNMVEEGHVVTFCKDPFQTFTYFSLGICTNKRYCCK